MVFLMVLLKVAILEILPWLMELFTLETLSWVGSFSLAVLGLEAILSLKSMAAAINNLYVELSHCHTSVFIKKSLNVKTLIRVIYRIYPL